MVAITFLVKIRLMKINPLSKAGDVYVKELILFLPLRSMFLNNYLKSG